MEYVSSEKVHDILVVGFSYSMIVDPITVQSIADEIVSKVENTDSRRLILDFSGVEFVSSELVGRLVSLRRYCQVKGIALKLAGLSSSFREVLELTNLRKLFKTYRTRNSAIEMFAADDFVIRQRFFESYASTQPEENNFAAPVAVAPLRLTVEQDASAFNF